MKIVCWDCAKDELNELHCHFIFGEVAVVFDCVKLLMNMFLIFGQLWLKY